MIKIKLPIVIFSILCILIYLIAPFKIIQAICFATLLLIVLSYFYSKNICRNIKIERSISNIKLAKKEQAKITYRIKNYSRLPVFLCYVYDDVKTLYVFHNKNAQLVSLRPKEVKQLTYTILAQERGIFEIGPVKIRTSDPLNLFPFELQIDNTAKITIRPERIRLSTNVLPALPQGLLDIKNPCYEDITMRRSIREYQNGDEIKRINWRAFAKFGSIYTNEYEDTYDTPFFVFLNLAEEDYDFPTRIYKTETAIEIAAAIIETATKLNQRVGFACFGTDFPFISPKQNQSDFILDMLATIKTVPGHLDYIPEKKYKPHLPNRTLFFSVGPDEVGKYEVRTGADIKDIQTNALGIVKKI